MPFPTIRQEPRRFRTIAETLNFPSCFSLYNAIFQELGVSSEIATNRMIQNYEYHHILIHLSLRFFLIISMQIKKSMRSCSRSTIAI